ncbi:MAG: hypothetical protein VX044_02560 [Planctomycetota bacterium]|nr:hypothetical protein [Planctomycetota bacterium]
MLGALLALSTVPCVAQKSPLERDVQQALKDARPALTAHLKAASRGVRSGELALLCLAGLHDGISPSDRVLSAALSRLAKAKPDQTYDLALRLLVLEACATLPGRRDLAKRDLKALLTHRSPDGAFQYGPRPSTWDLSNTQYGALGLRAASSMGLKIGSEVWSKLARTIGANQTKSGGFDYGPVRSGDDSYASMTVAGIAVLAICKQALGARSQPTKRIDAQLDRAWAWMADRQEAIGSAKERSCYYFHYGLERAAILCDVVMVGGKTDWYAKGARMLIEDQRSGGGWSSSQDAFPGSHLSNGRGDSVPTAFAVLFLRRRFQKNAGPITGSVVRLANIGPRSKPEAVEECARQLVAAGVPSMPDVLKAMRSDVGQQRQVAAKALTAITGEGFGFDPAADREANRAAVRRAELWYLKNR